MRCRRGISTFKGFKKRLTKAAFFYLAKKGNCLTYGLQIFARSMTVPTSGGSGKGFAHNNSWQYHPRSDRHSKILCWGIFFDLISRKNLISQHLSDEKISFGINHKMRDFAHNREKDLDLVICRRATSAKNTGTIRNFRDMVNSYTIVLTTEEQAILNKFPEIPLTGVQTALIALEAKAAMTEFGKARPRIYDELNSSHLTIHGDTDPAIAAGFAIVNLADTFVSPLRNPWKIGSLPSQINSHKQPSAAISMIEKVGQLPRRSSLGQTGFDALGLALVKCANDGSEVELCKGSPSPRPGELLYYENFIERIETIYASRFSAI
jgi:hypothetical protein